MIAFTIPGKPIAWARAHTNGVQRYTPEPQAGYMAVVSMLARSAMAKAGYAPFRGPVEMRTRATFLYPKTWSAARRSQTRWKDSKPDSSNLRKIIEDACNGIVFSDDAQIASGSDQKVYGPTEGVVVTIACLEEYGAS